MDELSAAHKALNELSFSREIFVEMLFYGPDILRFPGRFAKLLREYDTMEEGQRNEEITRLMEGSTKFCKDHDLAQEQKVFDALFPTYLE